jgi:tetratricopeptide (TPR) repeat protein
MRVVLIFILSVIALHVSAQSEKEFLEQRLRLELADTARINALNRLAYLNRAIDPARSWELLRESDQLLQRVDYPEGKSNYHNHLGVLFYRQGNYTRAAEQHLAALKIREHRNDRTGMMKSYINLGNVYGDLLQYSRAAQFYEKAEQLLLEQNDSMWLARVYNNQAALSLQMNNYVLCKSYCTKVFQLNIGDDDPTLLGQALNNFGVAFQYELQLDSAQAIYNRAYQLGEKSGDKTLLTDATINLGNVHRMQGQSARAIAYHSEALELAASIGYAEGIRVAYESLSLDYEAQGNWKEAFVAHRRFKQVSDSLLNEHTTQTTSELFSLWEQELKAREWQSRQGAAQAEQERQSRRTERIVTGALVLLALVGITVMYLRGRRS